MTEQPDVEKYIEAHLEFRDMQLKRLCAAVELKFRARPFWDPLEERWKFPNRHGYTF